MPPNFDITKSTERYIAVNMSASPPTLVSRSTFFPKEVIAFLLKPENADTTLKVIDLKRGCEVFLNTESRLEREVSVVCKDEEAANL